MSTMIEVDSRGRTSLPKALRDGDGPARYLAERLPDGVLVLRPAAVIPLAELAMLRDPQIEAGYAHLESLYGDELT